MKSESTVQSEIIKDIKFNGGYVVKIIKGNENGISDLIACIEGLFISAEIKAEKYHCNPLKQASEWQKLHLKRVKDANGISMCVSTLEQFKTAVIEHIPHYGLL